jgi:hypothetical protein
MRSTQEYVARRERANLTPAMSEPASRRDAESNPYASPEAGEFRAAFAPEGDDAPLITPQTVLLMRQTRPWVFLLSVVGFLAAAVSVARSIFTIAAGHETGRYEGTIGMFVVLLFYALPAALLWRYGGRISDFLRRPDLARLDAALVAQRSFWRTVGVLGLLALLLVLVLVAMAVFGAVFASRY